jgi:hypothetical protein
MGGEAIYYAPSALLTGKFQIHYSENLSFGLLYEYFLSEFRDFYTHNYYLVGEHINRSFNETMIIKTTPLVFLVEYSPVTTPYKTYVGGGPGISFDDIYWNEEVISNLPGDRRHSSIIYDDTHISSVIKLYLGVLLNFDKKDEKDFLGALHFEMSINYIFRSLKIYENLNEQFVKPQEEFNQRYFVLPFYLSLSAGISFNLFHRLK